MKAEVWGDTVVRGAASFLSSLIGPDSSSPLGMSAIATLHTTPWARLPPMELHVLDTRWSDLSGGGTTWRHGGWERRSSVPPPWKPPPYDVSYHTLPTGVHPILFRPSRPLIPCFHLPHERGGAAAPEGEGASCEVGR